ncbi:hypothetical protein F5Y07DRAFT_361937 [Xylaria sp. FL0933]|nr:hypothetical protein F5Y07DRAFT_361937 [Xylaria sp. FL0933]
MAPSDEVQDMSVNGSKNWRIVTLLIGKKRRAFEVHLQRLGPLAAELESVPEGEIHRPNWDPEVFNLVVNWAYNRPLPRVRDLTRWFDQNKPHSNLSFPKADEFAAPIVESSEKTSEGTIVTDRCQFNTITAQSQYQTYSIEELRLHFTKPTTPSDMGREVGPTSPSTQCDNTLSNKDHPRGGDLGGLHSSPIRLSIPPCIPDKEAGKAGKGQRLLLRLIIFAETRKWEPLFNDAIDAFQYGEAQLHRLYTPLSHIKLAFAGFRTLNTLQRFLFDHAMALGYENKTMSKYQDLLSSNPEFLSLMLSGIDSRDLAWFKRPCQNSEQLVHNDPLKVFYHNHSGSLVLDCKCRAMVDCFAQANFPNAPSLDPRWR